MTTSAKNRHYALQWAQEIYTKFCKKYPRAATIVREDLTVNNNVLILLLQYNSPLWGQFKAIVKWIHTRIQKTPYPDASALYDEKIATLRVAIFSEDLLTK